MTQHLILNEFTARKLGEVLAFSRVGAETWKQAHPAFNVPDSGADTISNLVRDLNAQAKQLEELAAEVEVAAITLTKAESTGNKLRQMRDLYIGDAWDNPAELLEWSGFFEGAAVVHWSLVVGAAESIG